MYIHIAFKYIMFIYICVCVCLSFIQLYPARFFQRFEAQLRGHFQIFHFKLHAHLGRQGLGAAREDIWEKDGKVVEFVWKDMGKHMGKQYGKKLWESYLVSF